MMYKEYKLKHFFMCVLVLVIGIVAFIAYASRKNAPSNITDNGVDVSPPFYATPKTDNYNADHDSGHGENTESTTEEGDAGHETPKEGH
jgi:hypothetical protein